MESFRIAHAVFNGKEYERLEYLDGEPRQIVRRGHSLKCMHPGHQLVRIYQQQNPGSENGSKGPGVGRYYQFAVAGKDRVAGRDVVEIAVMPLDAYRFGYTLALDKDTGLLMRSSLLGRDGEVIEQFQFVEVAIGVDIPRSLFDSGGDSYQASHGHRKPAETMLAGARPSGVSGWRVTWLPVGFTSTSSVQPHEQPDMRTFTDGLTVFSVFLETLENPHTGAEGRAQQGATIAYSRSLLLDNRAYRVTVIGEIPDITAKKVAKSVTLANI
jgi:sigma-E factor negative regulatory protein RseB